MRQNQRELQGETDESTMINKDFNTSLSEMDRYNGQKINTDIVELDRSSISWI